jgi:O-antigen/teichoic acid export membrane protein
MRLIPVVALVAGAAAVGLYFLLIPPFSYVGAAWATVTALWLMAVLIAVVSQRIYPVPWDWRRLSLAIAATFGLALAALAVDAWMPFSASLPVRVAITLAYPATLLLGGFLTASDRQALRSRLRR